MGLYEYLERLKGKIRDDIFFCVNKSDNYSVYSLDSVKDFLRAAHANLSATLATDQKCTKLTSNQISVANAGLKKGSYQRSVVVAWYTPEVVCESKDIFNDVFSWDQSRRVRWTSSLW